MGGEAGGGGEGAAFCKANVLQPAHVSLLDASHQAAVADLLWLPGLAATRDGRLEPAPGGAGECNLFATVALDGRVLVWDQRVHPGGRRRGGQRPTAGDDEPPEWRPALVLPVLQGATGGQPLAGCTLALDPKPSATTRLVVGSLEGGLAVVDANIRAVRQGWASGFRV